MDTKDASEHHRAAAHYHEQASVHHREAARHFNEGADAEGRKHANLAHEQMMLATERAAHAGRYAIDRDGESGEVHARHSS